MDEIDLTAAESKATYEEIKEYVLEYIVMDKSVVSAAQFRNVAYM